MSEEARFGGIARALGAANAGVIPVDAIPFQAGFRTLCEMNACGQYGRCWMCPPDMGPIEALIEQAQNHASALVFQTIGQLEDSFDIEGMESAAQHHNRVTRAIADALAPLGDNPLVLGAGACRMCAACARTVGAACTHPHRALSSLEAYGIAVSELAPLCGMHYTNGPNTVTYFGAILHGRKAGTSDADP
jgi:predicted metal-binding protein